jgi:transposase-like protein
MSAFTTVKLYSISEAARELGLSAEWLREGEKRGSLPKAKRGRNGYRVYTEEDIERLRNRRLFVHPSGERYLWHSEAGLEIAHVEAAELKRRLRELATATLIARHLPEIRDAATNEGGGRHDYAMALSGFMLRSGRLDEKTTLKILMAAWDAKGWPDEGARREAHRDLAGIIHDTAQNLSAGEPVVGGPTLDEYAPEMVRLLSKWWGWAREESRDNEPGEAEERKPTRDLIIAATNSWCAAFDNISNLPPWLSDAYCRPSTGGGFSARELCTDSEEVLFDATRPVILNGITDVATRPDLLDRGLIVTLPPIPEEKRRPEAELWRDFEKARPRIPGALFDAVSGALGAVESVRLEGMPRMADFAVWATLPRRAWAGNPARSWTPTPATARRPRRALSRLTLWPPPPGVHAR